MNEKLDIQALKKIKKQLKECEQTKQEYLEGWQRVKADFINYQRRMENAANEKIERSNQSLLLKFLKIIDDFERLEEASHRKDINLETLKTAVQQIQKKIEKFFIQENITQIETLGKEFDPRWHEAIQQVTSPQKHNTIVEEVETGYLINGKLLRPAKVKVAN